MEKYKGYTLVELLAVIVILGIISVIAVPAYTKYVSKGQDMYYKNLEETVSNAGREYMNQNPNFLPKSVGNYIKLDRENIIGTGVIEKIVSKNEKECEEAHVYVGKLKNGKYTYISCLKCDDYESKKEICKEGIPSGGTDLTPPIEPSVYVKEKTTNSIKLTGTCTDRESEIVKYEFSINNSEYKDSGNNRTYEFTKLQNNEKYEFRMRCTNKAGLTSESKVIGETASLDRPTIKELNPSEYEYSAIRRIEVKYNNKNVKTPYNYIKTTVNNVTTDVDIYECKNGINAPCEETATKTMKRNVLYKTGSKVVITFDKEGTLYAQLTDGINKAPDANYEVTKIDPNVPIIKVKQDPLKVEAGLKGKNYDFINNITVDFGALDGTVTCDPSSASMRGTYTVKCTAKSENGMMTSAQFEAKFLSCEDSVEYCYWKRPHVDEIKTNLAYYTGSNKTLKSTAASNKNYPLSNIYDDNELSYWKSRSLTGSYCPSDTDMTSERVNICLRDNPTYVRAVAMKAGSSTTSKVSAMNFYANYGSSVSGFYNTYSKLEDKKIYATEYWTIRDGDWHNKLYCYIMKMPKISDGGEWYIIESINKRKFNCFQISIYKTTNSGSTNSIGIFDIKILTDGDY